MANMTRKHFTAIAQALQDSQPSRVVYKKHAEWFNRYEQWIDTVHEVVDTLSQFNPGFDRERFYGACGFIAPEAAARAAISATRKRLK